MDEIQEKKDTHTKNTRLFHQSHAHSNPGDKCVCVSVNNGESVMCRLYYIHSRY